jgi:beta-glucosidase
MFKHSKAQADISALAADFVFGVATAAYQIEGGVKEGGRGVSIWDTFSHTPGKTLHGDTGDIACDHYHRWAADLDLMKDLGIQGYRLNFSWARLQPTGEGDLNPEGVEFYRDILKGCHDRGIKPFVTIYHWDLPQALQDKGGWPARETAFRFGEYTALLIDEFADLAEDWITINEAWCVAYLGHSWGMQAPGFKDDALAIRAAHHVLLAHGLALAQFRKKAPQLRVGITNIHGNVTAKTNSSADQAAAAELDVRMNKLFLEPLYKGSYSDDVVAVFEVDGLNAGEIPGALVQPGDLALISAPTDFIGVNHYHNMIASASEGAPNGIGMEQATPNEQSSWNWPNTPYALGNIVRRINRDYSDLPIVITENGITLNDYAGPDGKVNDPDRIDYLNGYINEIAKAARDGVPMAGYFAWSFMDNFEWAEGYNMRFGLVHVDYPTQTRTPKQSAFWYRNLISEHKKKAAN